MKPITPKRETLSNGTVVVTTNHPFEGLPNGEERLAKVKLAQKINDIIAAQKMTQKQAAKLLTITQPEVSDLCNGRISNFTFDRLYRCLTALNMDIEISVKVHNKNSDNHAGIFVLKMA